MTSKNTNHRSSNTPKVTWNFPVDTTDLQGAVSDALVLLQRGHGPGGDMTGWISWPETYLVSEEYARLKDTAQFISETNDAVVVIGIGGSYLTPEMVLHSCFGSNYNLLLSTQVFFAGIDMNPEGFETTLQLLEGKKWSVVYISKSGGTIEPALTFRFFYDQLIKKFGYEEANRRVYAVTDSCKGILKNLATEHNWDSFVIPDNIGGRYSGFTACGLLPLAIAGLDTDKLLHGAIEATKAELSPDSFAAAYACWRYLNYSMGYNVEFLAFNTPDLCFFGEWIKQLFGESEGKDKKGLFPASGAFPRDLHSLGQFLQQGSKEVLFETFIERKSSNELEIPVSNGLRDNLAKYTYKRFYQAAAAAMDGAYQAHSHDGNPCGQVYFGTGLKNFGYLMYSFFVSCAVYCTMIGVNPFDQPGVELHKKIMRTSPAWGE